MSAQPVRTTRASAPPEGTVEAWAWDYILSRDSRTKLNPVPPPTRWESQAPARRLVRPGRPADWVLIPRATRTPKPGALVRASARAQLLHGFHHHEVQAAELFCWALLAFVDTPLRFRRGLLAIAVQEIEHARLYREQLERLGSHVGAFPVRDWFWERVPSVPTPLGFVALMGMGLEAGNLEHGQTFARHLRNADDEQAAAVVDQVAQDEEAHVRFAVRWFRRWAGPLQFELWRQELPPPLTPTPLRGLPLARAARLRTGQPAEFLDSLEAWPASGS